MIISSIVAMGKNRVIGANNQMMWSIPSEFNHYRSLLADHNFVIGRKNFEGSKETLNQSKALILSRNHDYQSVTPVFHDPQSAIDYARDDLGEKELFILGGEQIYRVFMPFIDRLYLSIVNFELKGDAYFPAHESYNWDCKKQFTRPVDDHTPIEWDFFELHKA